jgi:hypothetical protein
MVNAADFLAKVSARLNQAGIAHMLAGSVATIAYSGPRNTQDLDLVISATAPQLDAFLASVDPNEFYVSAEAAREALQNNSMFNLIDLESGWKADLIFRRPRPFSLEEFDRRTLRNVWGVELPMVTPEDSILSKLEWRKESRSERQYSDAVRVAQSAWEGLDRDYLRKWGKELEIADDLEQLLRDAEQLRPK